MQQFTTAACHVKGNGGAHACRHVQAGRRVADHRVRAIQSGVVNKTQARAAHGHGIQASHGHAGGIGFDTGPSAVAVALGAHQGQAKLHTGHLQGHATGYTNVHLGIGCPQGQEVDQHTCCRLIGRCASGVARQFDGRGVAQKGEVTTHVEKVSHSQLRATDSNLLETLVQAAKGIALTRHGDGLSGHIGVCGVPANACRAGAELCRRTQADIRSASGFQQHATKGCVIAEHQGDRCIGNPRLEVPCSHQRTGVGGQHAHLSCGCVFLKRKIATQHQAIIHTNTQTRDAQHRCAQGTHGAECVRKLTKRKAAL